MKTKSAKELAKMVLTGSDRITKAMRELALKTLDDAVEAEKCFMAVGDIDLRKDQFMFYMAMSGRKVEAVKKARREFDLGLKEAVRFVEDVFARGRVVVQMPE